MRVDPTLAVRRATARLYQRIGAQLILLVASGALFFFLLYFTLNSTFASRVFDEAVNSGFRGRLGWTRVTWGPLPWEVHILEPVLVGPDGEPVITAAGVHVRSVALLGFLAGRIEASDISVEKPVVRLVGRVHPTERDDLGRPATVFNIAEMWWAPVKEPDDGHPGDIVLDFSDVTITGASFLLDMPSLTVKAEDIDIHDASFRLESRGAESDMRMGAKYVSARDASVRVGDGDALYWPLTQVTAHNYFWNGTRFGVGVLRSRLRGDPLRVERFAMDLDTPGLPHVSTRLELETPAIEKHLEPLGVAGVRGRVDLRVFGRGELDAFDGVFELRCRDLEAAGVRVDRCLLGGRKDPDDQVELGSLEVEAYGARLTGTGHYDIGGGHAFSELSIADLDPTRLPVELGADVVRLLAGSAKGHLFARARDLYDPSRRLTVDGHLSLARTGGAVFGLSDDVRVDLAAGFESNRLQIGQLRARAGPDLVRAEGLVDFGAETLALDTRVRLREVRPYARALDVPVSGAVDLRARLSGAFADPSAEGELKGTQVRYGPWPEADLEGGLGYAGGSLRVRGMEVRSPAATARVDGSVGVARPRTPLDLRVTARGVDLARLPLGEPVRGVATADVHLQGTAAAPKIAGEVSVVEPGWRTLDFQRLDLKGRYAGREVEISRLRLASPHPESRMGRPLLRASGRVLLPERGSPGGFDGELAITSAPLELVNHFLEAPLPLKGALSLNWGGSGTFADPHGQGRLAIEGFGYGDLDFGDGELNLKAGGQTLDVAGRLFEHFGVQAALPTAPGRPGSVAVDFDSFALESLLPQVEEAGLKTRLTGRVTADVDPFTGELGVVQARLPEMTIDLGAVTLRAPTPVQLSYAHGVVAIDELRVETEGQSLGIAGTLGADGILDVDVAGELDLSVVQRFIPEVFSEMDGKAVLFVTLSGPVTDPVPSGRVRLLSAELTPRSAVVGREIRLVRPAELEILPAYGPMPMQQDADAVRGVFTVSLPLYGARRPGERHPENRMWLQRDEGRIEVSRLDVHFVDFKPETILVELDSEELEVNIPRTLRATAAVRGLRFEMWQHRRELRPPETRMKVSGEIELVRGEYLADIAPTGELNRQLRDNLAGRSRARQVSLFERVPALKRLMVDVQLRGDGDFFIRNQVTLAELDLELKTRLAVRGFLYQLPGDDDADALRIDGEVNTLSDSKITYLRRDYEVQQGLVRFGEEADGQFLAADLVASHTFTLRVDQGVASTTFDRGAAGEFRDEEVTIIAVVTLATLDTDPQYDIQFESSSGLSDLEIATLITTGSLPRDLSGASSAQPVAEIAFGPLFGVLTSPIEETLDLELSLSTGDAGTLLVDAEKLLSRRLKLYSRTPIGDDDDSDPVTFGLEYRLNNSTYGEVTNERLGEQNLFGARVRLRMDLQ